MIKILGMTDEPCDWTGTTDDVVRFKAAPGTLSGNICWGELLRIVKRKSREAESGQTATSKQAQPDAAGSNTKNSGGAKT